MEKRPRGQNMNCEACNVAEGVCLPQLVQLPLTVLSISVLPPFKTKRKELQADFAAVRLDPAVRQGAVERMHKTQALLSSKERTGVGLLARASERMRGLSTHPPTSLRVWLATHLPPGDAQGT